MDVVPAADCPSIDCSAVPSIVLPLESTTGIKWHSHPQHQLAWAPDGVLVMAVDDCRWVVQRSRALWMPGGVPHSVTPSSPCAMLSLYFEPDECPLDWSRPTVVDATGLVGPLLTHLAGLPKPRTAQRDRANAVLWDLLSPLAVTTIPTVLPTDPQARKVAMGIRDNPADKRGLPEWGHEVGASARTLSRRFREQTGSSFERWRTLERLNAALPLLGAGAPITRVAREVGYHTASAFIAAFRREVGTTPAAYFGA
ncbi:AraC family transcriptional regulator [Actinocrispum wychmicini]|uniref:HTH-type transcriptional regulator RipA n=1 Tax=Actinocrispum wychmicini TaxID=1213861 RepID=A0A4R2JQ61_9PSEU|nr:helix-turn-helix transcriptional regulator [Actinocrispum wychmicini]TCO62343.1 AraC-like DNA-binding protein [Actinocrispum wychmicini]